MPSVIFSSINDDYYWGNYGDFKILIMKDNGYINATKMCQLSEGKEFSEWKRNQTSQEKFYK